MTSTRMFSVSQAITSYRQAAPPFHAVWSFKSCEPTTTGNSIFFCCLLGFLEACVSKGAFMIFGGVNFDVLDLAAYNGYKYVHTSFLMLLYCFLGESYISGGTLGYLMYVAFAYFAAAAAFTQYRFLNHAPAYKTAEARQMGVQQSMQGVSKQIVLGLAAFQVAAIYLLMPTTNKKVESPY